MLSDKQIKLFIFLAQSSLGVSNIKSIIIILTENDSSSKHEIFVPSLGQFHISSRVYPSTFQIHHEARLTRPKYDVHDVNVLYHVVPVELGVYVSYCGDYQSRTPHVMVDLPRQVIYVIVIVDMAI